MSKIDLKSLKTALAGMHSKGAPWRGPGCDPYGHNVGRTQTHEGPFGGICATGPDVQTKEQAIADAAAMAAAVNACPALLQIADAAYHLLCAVDDAADNLRCHGVATAINVLASAFNGVTP